MNIKFLILSTAFLFLLSCSKPGDPGEQRPSFQNGHRPSFQREEISKALESCEKSYETCKVTAEAQKDNCSKLLSSLEKDKIKPRSAYILCAGQTCSFDIHNEQFKKCLTLSLAAHQIFKHHGHKRHIHRNHTRKYRL